MKQFRTLVATVALCVASVLLAAPAMGISWKSASDPLYVYEDDIAQGKTYGRFYNDESVRAMSTSYQYDLKPGGNYVRVETDFLFYGPDTSCEGSCWRNSASKQSEKSRSEKWVKDSRARNLEPEGEKARGGIDICEIQAWHNDPCSSYALPTFSY